MLTYVLVWCFSQDLHTLAIFELVIKIFTLVPSLLLFIAKFCDANRFSYFFSRHEALRVANFQMKKDNIKRKPLGPGYKIFGIFNIAVSTNLYVFISIELTPDSVHTYVPVESKLQYPPSGNPPGN